MWLAFHGSGRGARTRENHPRRPDLNPGVLRVRRDGSPRGIREPFQFHELRRLPGTSCLRKRRLSAAWEQLQSREIRDWQPLQHYNLYTLQARNEAESGARAQRFKSALRTGALRRCSIALARCATSTPAAVGLPCSVKYAP